MSNAIDGAPAARNAEATAGCELTNADLRGLANCASFSNDGDAIGVARVSATGVVRLGDATLVDSNVSDVAEDDALDCARGDNAIDDSVRGLMLRGLAAAPRSVLFQSTGTYFASAATSGSRLSERLVLFLEDCDSRSTEVLLDLRAGMI